VEHADPQLQELGSRVALALVGNLAELCQALDLGIGRRVVGRRLALRFAGMTVGLPLAAASIRLAVTRRRIVVTLALLSEIWPAIVARMLEQRADRHAAAGCDGRPRAPTRIGGIIVPGLRCPSRPSGKAFGASARAVVHRRAYYDPIVAVSKAVVV